MPRPTGHTRPEALTEKPMLFVGIKTTRTRRLSAGLLATRRTLALWRGGGGKALD